MQISQETNIIYPYLSTNGIGNDFVIETAHDIFSLLIIGFKINLEYKHNFVIRQGMKVGITGLFELDELFCPF